MSKECCSGLAWFPMDSFSLGSNMLQQDEETSLDTQYMKYMVSKSCKPRGLHPNITSSLSEPSLVPRTSSIFTLPFAGTVIHGAEEQGRRGRPGIIHHMKDIL